jgi:predicted DNA-binding transcriptional regulator AlpA
MYQSNELLKLNQVLQLVPVSRSTWLRGIHDGIYPKPVKISSHLNVWHAEDIEHFLQNLKPKSNQETSDSYEAVICQIVNNHRVILCKRGLQWIIQSSDGYRGGRRRWTGKSYVTSRNKLIELCRGLDGFSEQVHLPILLGLSESVGG